MPSSLNPCNFATVASSALSVQAEFLFMLHDVYIPLCDVQLLSSSQRSCTVMVMLLLLQSGG